MERGNVDEFASSIAPRMRSHVRHTVRGGFEHGGQCSRTSRKKKEGVTDGVVDGGTADDDGGGDRKWW